MDGRGGPTHPGLRLTVRVCHGCGRRCNGTDQLPGSVIEGVPLSWPMILLIERDWRAVGDGSIVGWPAYGGLTGR